jgi:hypothetical protein
MKVVFIASICVGLAAVACGSAATTSSSSGGVSGGSLTVSGSVSVTTHELSNSAIQCTGNASAGVSAILAYDTYTLQFFLPSGTTTFPAPAGVNAGVTFYNSNDSSQQWAIGGSGDAGAAAGTATLSSDGKRGSVDVDMVPHPAHPNPNLKPIHVKGTFSCS